MKIFNISSLTFIFAHNSKYSSAKKKLKEQQYVVDLILYYNLKEKLYVVDLLPHYNLKEKQCNNNNNKHFSYLQVANSPSRLRFEANLSRESSECTEHSQDQMSQINTGKTVYVGNA